MFGPLPSLPQSRARDCETTSVFSDQLADGKHTHASRQEGNMRAARPGSLTSRRKFLRHGATLAGVVALPAGGVGAIATTPNSANPNATVRLAQAAPGTAAAPSAVTVKST